MRETVVVSLGGSVLYSNGKFDSAKVNGFCKILVAASKKTGLVVVVGGGPLARKKVDAVRKAGGSEFHADVVAIQATRENARRVAKFLKNSVFVTDFSKAPSLLARGKIVVSGGMIPGITTDTVAVLFAELAGARRLVNVSNVAGIYTADPRKNAGAKLIRRLSHEKLVRMASKADSRKARVNFVFDLVASKLAARSRISLYFVSAGNFQKALFGRAFSGTVVA
ncbi:MAG: UMP kinase [Candidatus Micrarchaeota archaeon]